MFVDPRRVDVHQHAHEPEQVRHRVAGRALLRRHVDVGIDFEVDPVREQPDPDRSTGTSPPTAASRVIPPRSESRTRRVTTPCSTRSTKRPSERRTSRCSYLPTAVRLRRGPRRRTDQRRPRHRRGNGEGDDRTGEHVDVRQASTDASGFYRMHVAGGDYTFEASKTNYETGSADVTIDVDITMTQDFSAPYATRQLVISTSLELRRSGATQTHDKDAHPVEHRRPADDVGRQVSRAAVRRCQILRHVGLEAAQRQAEQGRSRESGVHRQPARVTLRAALDAGPPLDPTWSHDRQLPAPIMDNSAAFIDGKEYVVGGFDFSFAITNKGTSTTRTTTRGRRSPTWRSPARSRAWQRSTGCCT